MMRKINWLVAVMAMVCLLPVEEVAAGTAFLNLGGETLASCPYSTVQGTTPNDLNISCTAPTGQTVQFSSATYATHEGGIAGVVINRIGGNTGDVQVTFQASGLINGDSVSDGTTTFPVTNGSAVGIITFPSGGAISKTVSILTSMAGSANRSISLLLAGPTAPVQVGAPGNSVVSVTDLGLIPGSQTVEFQQSIFSVPEGQSIAIPVVRIGGSTGTVNVDVNVLGITGANASASDYAFFVSQAFAVKANNVTVPISQVTLNPIQRAVILDLGSSIAASDPVTVSFDPTQWRLTDRNTNLVTAIAAGSALSVIQPASNLVIQPLPEVTNDSTGSINLADAQSGGGTDVVVSLPPSAQAGNVLTLTWGNQAPIQHTLQASDITAAQATVQVPTSIILAEGNSGAVPLIAKIGALAARPRNPVVDVVPPSFLGASAAGGGSQIVLDFGEALKSITLVPGDFSVNPGTPVAPSAVAMDAPSGKVTLTLAAPVVAGDTVTVSYTPASSAISDAFGNGVSAITNATVINPPATAPTVSNVPTTVVNLAAAASGVPVTASLSATGAIVGDTISLFWGNQPQIDHVLVAGDITAGEVVFTVPQNIILASAPGTQKKGRILVQAQLNTTPKSLPKFVSLDVGAPQIVSANMETASQIRLVVNENYAQPVTGSTLTFADGEVVKSISLVAFPDADRTNETITLALANAIGATIAPPPLNLAAVGLVDDDVSLLSFAAATSSVTEGNSVQITVQRTGSSAGAVSGSISLGGTATNVTDYTLSTTTVNFADGETSKLVTLNAVSDQVSELAGETVALTLGSPTNGATLGAQTQHIVTINDAIPNGALQFSTASSTVNEGASVTVTVTRSGGSAGAVSATVSLGGTATNGADYTVNPTTVSFADGDTANKTITLNAAADGTSDPSETAVLTLTSVTGGASLGNLSSHTVTINDVPPAGGGIPPSCPDQTFPLANIRDFTWFGGGLTQDVNLASGQTLAYRFTLGANGAVMDFTTNTLTGGQLAKDVAISACPGQFTQLANAECIKTFSTQDTRIFVGSTLLCPLPAGTYFVNIRPSPVGSGGARSLKMGGFAL